MDSQWILSERQAAGSDMDKSHNKQASNHNSETPQMSSGVLQEELYPVGRCRQ
jgi:hypothetical protein